MKSNKIAIRIDKPASEVFAFAINPKNTPAWIPSITKEETNEWPIKIGSVYRNQNKAGGWSEYFVSALKENKLFELVSKSKNYHVRYTYNPIDDSSSELEYYEWVDEGELEDPFPIDLLEKLKSVLEIS